MWQLSHCLEQILKFWKCVSVYAWLLPLTRPVALFRDVPDVSNFLRLPGRQKQKTPFKISSTVQLYPVPYKFDSSVNLGTGFLFTKQTLKEAASAMKLKVFLFCHTYDDAHPRIFALIAFFRRKYVGQCVSRSVSIPDCCLKACSTNVVPQINRQAVL